MHRSFPPADEARRKVLRVRLTPVEHARLFGLAQDQGKSAAEIVRSALAFTAFGKGGCDRNA